MTNKKDRKLKVRKQSGRNYRPTPTIMLKGQWLLDVGFDMRMDVVVRCEEGRLVITPREVENYVDAFEGYRYGEVSKVADGGRGFY